MSRVVLSDDETDHESGTNLGQRSYGIVKEPWCSEELIRWLRTMDLLACGEKWDGNQVARRGNGMRLRIHSSLSNDRTAVRGLPENCYEPVWLNSLKPWEREVLGIKPRLDMQFTEEEQRFVFMNVYTPELMYYSNNCRSAARYIPLAKGDTRPSSENANFNGNAFSEWLLHNFGKVHVENQ